MESIEGILRMDRRLILYDTCNFRDYPIGGQLTSVQNFLRYLTETINENLGNVLLVGASTDENEIGHITEITVGKGRFPFLAVAKIETDLSNVKKSLRMEYAKGLWRYRKLYRPTETDCNYFHTPEAFGVVKAICPKAVCYVMSHGSYIGMWKKLRFFNHVPVIQKLFQAYLVQVIKWCDWNFVLDQKTAEEYEKYSSHVIKVSNSIVCREFQEKEETDGKIRLIYAGRLSEGKNLLPVIRTVRKLEWISRFDIVGDGEERYRLEQEAENDSRIVFIGAVAPNMVGKYLGKSDVMIMNSKYEGIPMTILEALSYGLPVVSTNVGGIGEVLHFGEDSECTDGSEESIQAALERIKKEYSSYQKKAYQTSLSYDYRSVNEKIFRILNDQLQWYGGNAS